VGRHESEAEDEESGGGERTGLELGLTLAATILQALGHVAEVAAAAASESADVHVLLLAAVLGEVLLPAVELAHLKPSQRGALRNAVAAAAPGILDLTTRCLPQPLLVR